jgi:integrase
MGGIMSPRHSSKSADTRLTWRRSAAAETCPLAEFSSRTCSNSPIARIRTVLAGRTVGGRFSRRDASGGKSPSTIKNALSLLRSALNHAVREDLIPRNPAIGVGRIVARIARSAGLETKQVQAWTRHEVETLLALSERHERPFAPMLRLLFSTGVRRSEALALKWQDIDFARGLVQIRRAATKGVVGTPRKGSPWNA